MRSLDARPRAERKRETRAGRGGRPLCCKWAKAEGFTLVELVIATALGGILLTLTAATFVEWLPRYQVVSAARTMTSVFQEARIKAVSHNFIVTLEIDDASGRYLMTGSEDRDGDGSLDRFEDLNDNGVVDELRIEGRIPHYARGAQLLDPRQDLDTALIPRVPRTAAGSPKLSRVSFRPNSTAGTITSDEAIYFSNRRGHLYAVSLTRSGRVRTWEYDEREARWETRT
ncbi:MAG: prepilin-type N-terminal cleavage/methylation domain-containing protein [Acidobacteriota bacterium]|nr:MAG: prepilin-type N-terminal cleavage/methylation domain-containing protein [Acidobacteriota bacterium]